MDCEFCTDPAYYPRVQTKFGVRSLCQPCARRYGFRSRNRKRRNRKRVAVDQSLTTPENRKC
jgi:hypothetical protein